jgi:peptide/nickel transport system substrate-binding protein
MNRLDRFAAVFLVLLLGLVGGGLLLPSTPSGPAQPTDAVSTTYHEGILGRPSSINPLTARTQADQDLVALLFRSLIAAGPDGTLAPDLAQSWTVSPDGHTYSFVLRSDARWDDGEPVTTADVLFTVGLLQDPAYDGPLGATWQGVQAVADGPYAMHFTTNLPIAGFLRQATLPILPKHLLADTPVADLADSDFSQRPLGDGPYRIVELDDTHALLQATGAVTPLPPTPSPAPASGSLAPSPSPSPSPTPTASPSPSSSGSPAMPSSSPGTGTGGIASVELDFYNDTATMLAQFQAGNLDAVGGLTPAQTATAAATPGAKYVDYRWSSMMGVILNQRTGHTEFQNARVRKGLLEAIDRGALLNQILDGHGTIAEAPLPSWSPNYTAGSITHTVFDRLAAQTDLAGGGWKRINEDWQLPSASGAFTLSLLTPDQASNPVVYAFAVQVAADWRAIGLLVTLDAVPAATFLDRVSAGQYSAAVVDLELGLDPDVSPLLLSTQASVGGSNVSGVADPNLDKLLLAARKATDPGDRQAAVAALEKYISAGLPLLPLCFRDYGFVVDKRVGGVETNMIDDPSGRFWDVIDWRLANDG